ncbi:MAG TPA: cytochrome c peroxidase [Bacteroidia bacterium]|jgi:cytochrome c peroxidase|nr:cytochrome c peroxidase [Bacteroidia bacterium]
MFRKYFHITLLIALVIVSLAFIGDNKYFTITKDDVKLEFPKDFPKPIYTFKDNTPTPEGFTLGRKLFFDPILSKDSSISCGFCHQRIAAFAHIDHPISHGINGLLGKRNVPPLQNLIWEKEYMWDGGVNNLEVQPISPITNPVEMNEDMEQVIKKLQRNKEYSTMFKLAFGDSMITSQKLLRALAQFTGLMVSSNSRYDKYVRHEDTLSRTELNGLKLFRDNCAQCHKEPLFTDNTYRNVGFAYDTSFKDSGRIRITGDKKDFMKFRVPSLRNIEMTYPYMHDGRFHTLKQVLDHYTNIDASAKGLDPILVKGINLTEGQKTDIIAFLKALTDKTFLYDRRFVDPNFVR